MPTFFQTHLPHLVSSAVIVLLALSIRALGGRYVRRSSRVSDDLRRRWIIQLRNASLLVALFGLLVIWGAELRTVAISAVAIAAAIVIAAKELIMCVTGTILEGAGQAFKLGDRIEVGGHRGDVIDQTLLTTTILEIGPQHLTHQHTGRIVVLPNSVFLSQPIINETFTDEYVLHVFTVPMKETDDWKGAEQRLLAAAAAECAPFIQQARASMEQLLRSQGLRTLSIDPRVTIAVPEPGRINLIVRMPVPARQRGRIEQAVLRRVLPITTTQPAPPSAPTS